MQVAFRTGLSVVGVAFGVSGILNAPGTIAAVGVAVALDLEHPFSLRNYFLAYVLAMFGVGAQHFAPDDLTLSVDLVLFLALFLASYSIVRLLWRPAPADVMARMPTRAAVLPSLLLILVAAGWAGLLAAQIGVYGLTGFYGGAALADRIAKYGHADFLTGLQSIVEQGLSILTVAVAVTYVLSRVDAGKRPSYLLLSLPLVVAPGLLLRRYDFTVGLMLLLAIQPIAARLCGLRYSILASIPLIVGSLGLAFAVSVMVGSLREIAVAAPPTPSASVSVAPSASPNASDPAAALASLRALTTEERTLGAVYSELSPIRGYRDIREHPSDFGYQFGKTILPPLVARVVPRSWFPEKPISSGAYYNQIRTPEAFAAGYALPITVFGDALLNFGYLGALGASAILGLLAGRLDRALDGVTSRGLAISLIVFYNFYSLLRTDLANSVSVIVLTAVTLVVLRRILQLWPISGRRALPS